MKALLTKEENYELQLADVDIYNDYNGKEKNLDNRIATIRMMCECSVLRAANWIYDCLLARETIKKCDENIPESVKKSTRLMQPKNALMYSRVVYLRNKIDGLGLRQAKLWVEENTVECEDCGFRFAKMEMDRLYPGEFLKCKTCTEKYLQS